MRELLGSATLGDFSEALDKALRVQASRLHAPDSRKSDKALRRFTIREMADIAFRMNYNTLRHHLKTIEGLPEGIMEPGNRRTFSLEEIHEIQQRLYEAGKIADEMFPGKRDGDETTKLLCYNLKGGVSKTTCSANLAQFLAMRGFKVLIVDLDPQASCSDLFDIQADLDEIPSIYDVLRYEDQSDGEARCRSPRRSRRPISPISTSSPGRSRSPSSNTRPPAPPPRASPSIRGFPMRWGWSRMPMTW